MRCKPGWPPFGYFASSGGCITWLPRALAWKFAQYPACHFFLLSTVIAALLRPFFSLLRYNAGINSNIQY